MHSHIDMKQSFFCVILVVCVFLNSAVSVGQECALESSAHADLLAAVADLKSKLDQIPKECTDGSSAMRGVNDLVASSRSLQEYWNNQALIASDPGQFGLSADSAMRSISTIGESLRNVTACAKAKKKDNLVALLSSVSDVTMNLAPILMAASIFIPTVRAGLGGAKVAAGVLDKVPVGKALAVALGVGVSTKLVESIVDIGVGGDSGLDIKGNAEHRKLVLKSICEYQRIQKQKDFLSTVNTGQIDFNAKRSEIKNRIASLKQHYGPKNPKLNKKYADRTEDEQRKAGATSEDLESLITDYEKALENIPLEIEKVAKIRSVLVDLDENLNISPDLNYKCTWAHKVVNDASLFAGVTIPEEGNIKALLEAVNENKNRINKQLASSKEAGPNAPGYDHQITKLTACVKEIELWKANVSILLNRIAIEKSNNAEVIFSNLRQDKRYIAWRKEFLEFQKGSKPMRDELNLLSRIEGYVTASPDRRQLIPEGELILGAKKLGKVIFEDRSFRSHSLAGLWLETFLDEAESSAKEFSEEYYNLNRDVNLSYGRAIEANFRAHYKDVTYPNIPTHLLKRKLEDVGTRWDLQNLSLDIARQMGTNEVIANQCPRLNKLLVVANESQKVINTARYFCNYLEKSGLQIERNMDPYIVIKCWGQNRGSTDYSQSGISRMLEDGKKQNGIITRAARVQLKMDEFSCKKTIDLK